MLKCELKCEKNTKSAERLVRGAFRDLFHRRPLAVLFEHGQWWVQVEDPVEDRTVTYSVVDAAGSGSSRGLSFEEI